MFSSQKYGGTPFTEFSQRRTVSSEFKVGTGNSTTFVPFASKGSSLHYQLYCRCNRNSCMGSLNIAPYSLQWTSANVYTLSLYYHYHHYNYYFVRVCICIMKGKRKKEKKIVNIFRIKYVWIKLYN